MGKGKKLHPDKNKAPNAKEQFVLLQEAYQYLSDVKTGKIQQEIPNVEEQFQNVYDIWQQIKAQAVREEAQRKSQMRYQKFLRETEEFKKFYRISIFFHFLFATISVFTLIIVPFIFIYKMGVLPGIIAWVALSAAVSPLYTLTWSGIKDFFIMKEKVKNMDKNAKP